MTFLIDSHIHISDQEYSSVLPHIINCMKIINMKACCVSTDILSSKKTIKLSEKCNLFFPFVGIHPNRTNDNIGSFIKFVVENSSKIKGIGEIGLDKTYAMSDYEFKKQKLYFITQLELAEKLHKPVSIHSRKTLDIIYQIIPSYSIPSISLHWFDGKKKHLEKAMDLGFFVSYGPLLIYSKDKQIMLLKTYENKILVETDGPVRFSKCFRHRPAQVCFIPSIVLAASIILNKTYDELSIILEQNAKLYLNI